MASRSWNRVELIGNLTRDPELRYTPNGAAVATFGIATNRTYLSDGERKEEVDFHRLVAWNKLAELCSQLLKKGHRVFISGRLQSRTWEQDGQQRNITEIVIEDMILLTPKAVGEYGTVAGDVNSVPVAPEVPPPEDRSTHSNDSGPASPGPGKADKKQPKEQPPPKETVSDDDLPF